MTLTRWAAAAWLAVTATFSISAYSAEQNACRLNLFGSIDLSVSDDGVRVPVTLEGKPGFMALDTSVPYSVFWKRSAREFSLRQREITVHEREHEFRPTVVANFNSLALGPVNLGKGAFFVVPEVPAQLSDAGPEATIGSLGADVFKTMDFELDLARKKLNLFSQDHCRGDVVYWTDTFAWTWIYHGRRGEMYFPMELDGKKVLAALTPNNRFTTLTTDTTRRLYGFDETSLGVQEETDRDQVVHRYRAMQISAHGLKVNNTKITLVPPPKGCKLTVDGHWTGGAAYRDCNAFPMELGRNVLRELRLYFATKEGRLYFTGAGATK